MSLYGSLFSGVTGLNAQSLALGVISENITNVNTTGFKTRTTNFATMVSGNGIESGSVGGVRHVVSKQTDGQGIVQQTSNDTDLAISGGGFFVVNSKVDDGRAVGDTMFTRAGHFSIDDDRQLANASGHFLMGWKLNNEGEFTDAAGNPITPDPTSESDLVPVDLSDVTFSSQATEEVKIQASFPATLKVGDNFNVTVPIFDGLGSTHTMDYSFTKADHVDFDGSIDETLGAVTTFNNIAVPAQLADGSLSSNTSVNVELESLGVNGSGETTFTVTVTANNAVSPVLGTPLTFDLVYDVGGNLTSDPIQQATVEWDGGLGAIDSILALDFSDLDFAGAPTVVTPAVNPNDILMKLDVATTNANDTFVGDSGTFVRFNTSGVLQSPTTFAMELDWDNVDTFAANSNIALDLTGLAVGGDTFSLKSTSQDGIAFGAFTGVSVDDEGFVIANFKNGTFLPVYRLPLADFNNPNGLKEVPGNAYISTLESGNFFLSQSGEGSVGDIVPRSLEQSTVDIAREFANMIITQRAFSSASTVITTADEMLQELVQIKR